MSAAGIIFDLIRTRLLIGFGCDLERLLSGLCRLLESFSIHLRIDCTRVLQDFLTYGAKQELPLSMEL